jgi:hypothetical protein
MAEKVSVTRRDDDGKVTLEQVKEVIAVGLTGMKDHKGGKIEEAMANQIAIDVENILKKKIFWSGISYYFWKSSVFFAILLLAKLFVINPIFKDWLEIHMGVNIIIVLIIILCLLACLFLVVYAEKKKATLESNRFIFIK